MFSSFNFKYFIISAAILLLLALVYAPHSQPLYGDPLKTGTQTKVGVQTEYGLIGTDKFRIYKSQKLEFKYKNMVVTEKINTTAPTTGSLFLLTNWLYQLFFFLITAIAIGYSKPISNFIKKTGSLKYTYNLSGKFIPWIAILALLLATIGIVDGLAFAPTDAKQKDSFRIIYIHVPAAMLCIQAYIVMSIASAIALIWRIKIAEIVAMSIAPLGAAITAIALITGSLWGARTWGTWWEWKDPRMVSVLILFFIYLGIMGLNSAIEDKRTAASATGIFTLSAFVIIPFIYVSVKMFNSLHQGSTQVIGSSDMHPDMARPLIVMFFATMLYFTFALLIRIRGEILIRDRKTQWVKDIALRS